MRKTTYLLAVLVVVLLSGCTQRPSFPSAHPLPTPAADPLPAPVPYDGLIPDAVIASARPLAPMPPPGQMPSGTFMRTIQDSGKLVAGVRGDLMLFGFVDPITGKRDGFDIAMIRAVARALFGESWEQHLELRTVLSAQRLPLLESGQVQLVAAVMTVNAPRRERIDFSELYFRAAQRVLVNADNAARGIQDMSDQRMCIAAGSTSIANALGANPAIARNLVIRDGESDCAAAMQVHEVDGVTSDDAILATLVPQMGNVKVIGEPFSDEPYGIGMQRGHPEFVAFVNGVLSEMKSSGEWKTLYERYLGAALTPGQPTPDPPKSVYQ